MDPHGKTQTIVPITAGEGMPGGEEPSRREKAVRQGEIWISRLEALETALENLQTTVAAGRGSQVEVTMQITALENRFLGVADLSVVEGVMNDVASLRGETERLELSVTGVQDTVTLVDGYSKEECNALRCAVDEVVSEVASLGVQQGELSRQQRELSVELEGRLTLEIDARQSIEGTLQELQATTVTIHESFQAETRQREQHRKKEEGGSKMKSMLGSLSKRIEAIEAIPNMAAGEESYATKEQFEAVNARLENLPLLASRVSASTIDLASSMEGELATRHREISSMVTGLREEIEANAEELRTSMLNNAREITKVMGAKFDAISVERESQQVANKAQIAALQDETELLLGDLRSTLADRTYAVKEEAKEMGAKLDAMVVQSDSQQDAIVAQQLVLDQLANDTEAKSNVALQSAMSAVGEAEERQRTALEAISRRLVARERERQRSEDDAKARQEELEERFGQMSTKLETKVKEMAAEIQDKWGSFDEIEQTLEERQSAHQSASVAEVFSDVESMIQDMAKSLTKRMDAIENEQENQLKQGREQMEAGETARSELHAAMERLEESTRGRMSAVEKSIEDHTSAVGSMQGELHEVRSKVTSSFEEVFSDMEAMLTDMGKDVGSRLEAATKGVEEVVAGVPTQLEALTVRLQDQIAAVDRVATGVAEDSQQKQQAVRLQLRDFESQLVLLRDSCTDDEAITHTASQAQACLDQQAAIAEDVTRLTTGLEEELIAREVRLQAESLMEARIGDLEAKMDKGERDKEETREREVAELQQLIREVDLRSTERWGEMTASVLDELTARATPGGARGLKSQVNPTFGLEGGSPVDTFDGRSEVDSPETVQTRQARFEADLELAEIATSQEEASASLLEAAGAAAGCSSPRGGGRGSGGDDTVQLLSTRIEAEEVSRKQSEQALSDMSAAIDARLSLALSEIQSRIETLSEQTTSQLEAVVTQQAASHAARDELHGSVGETIGKVDAHRIGVEQMFREMQTGLTTTIGRLQEKHTATLAAQHEEHASSLSIGLSEQTRLIESLRERIGKEEGVREQSDGVMGEECGKMDARLSLALSDIQSRIETLSEQTQSQLEAVVTQQAASHEAREQMQVGVTQLRHDTTLQKRALERVRDSLNAMEARHRALNSTVTKEKTASTQSLTTLERRLATVQKAFSNSMAAWEAPLTENNAAMAALSERVEYLARDRSLSPVDALASEVAGIKEALANLEERQKGAASWGADARLLALEAGLPTTRLSRKEGSLPMEPSLVLSQEDARRWESEFKELDGRFVEAIGVLHQDLALMERKLNDVDLTVLRVEATVSLLNSEQGSQESNKEPRGGGNLATEEEAGSSKPMVDRVGRLEDRIAGLEAGRSPPEHRNP